MQGTRARGKDVESDTLCMLDERKIKRGERQSSKLKEREEGAKTRGGY